MNAKGRLPFVVRIYPLLPSSRAQFAAIFWVPVGLHQGEQPLRDCTVFGIQV